MSSASVPQFKRRSKLQHARVRTQSEPEAAAGKGAEDVTPVSDLLALRQLREDERRLKSTGIDSERLNKKPRLVEPETAQATFGLRRNEDETSRLNATSFTSQTNALDVDKHLAAFIETELRKRRGDASAPIDARKELMTMDPRDELYKVAEKYNVAGQTGHEGNINLSMSMLTDIPEVDLGIETRLRNIEETEKAKRSLIERQEAEKRKVVNDDGGFAAARFYQPPQRRRTEQEIRAEAEAGVDGADQVEAQPESEHISRREFATDEAAVAVFTKRRAYRSG